MNGTTCQYNPGLEAFTCTGCTQDSDCGIADPNGTLNPPHGGYKCCNGNCVNLVNNLSNCGACGNNCGPNVGAGNACCGTSCKDLSDDPNNCNACGAKCPYGWVCKPTGFGGGACSET
jgi:hypothetical protein